MRNQDSHLGNFGFLKDHDPVFLQLASIAEQVFARDPNTTLLKLRQLGEAFARDITAVVVFRLILKQSRRIFCIV